MEKNIYGLLNEVEMDLETYKATELSEKEKERYKRNILHRIGNTNSKKRKNTWKKVVGAVAALAVILGVAGVANPVLAKDIYSALFGKLIEHEREQIQQRETTDSDLKKYAIIGKNAKEVSEEDKAAGETTVEKDGITFAVSDVYSDGYHLYYLLSLRTERKDFEKAEYIRLGKNIHGVEFKINGKQVYPDEAGSFKKIEDGLYTCVAQQDLSSLTDVNEQPVDISDAKTLTVEYSIKDRLLGQYWQQDQMEEITTGSVENTWKLQFSVPVDRSGAKEIVLNQESNGVRLAKASVTKGGLLLEGITPDFSQAPYNDPYNDPAMTLYDADGNILCEVEGSSTENADGTANFRVHYLYNGEKNLIFKITNKNVDNKTIAAFRFQVE